MADLRTFDERDPRHPKHRGPLTRYLKSAVDELDDAYEYVELYELEDPRLDSGTFREMLHDALLVTKEVLHRVTH